MNDIWLEAFPFKFPSYDSYQFLRQIQFGYWILKTFTRQIILAKDLYIVKQKLSKNQEKFNYYQHSIHNLQDKNLFTNIKIFCPKNKYYNAVINETFTELFPAYL